jgi:hypothetical protein
LSLFSEVAQNVTLDFVFPEMILVLRLVFF